MSCWVVPQVAAEIWGISLSEVLSRIHSGVVISKMEYGFLLVDTAPLGPMFHSTAAEGKAKPPTWVKVQTWVEVEDDEETIDDAGIDLELTSEMARAPRPCDDEDLIDGDSIEEEPDDGVALGWQQRRVSNARLRKPPR